MMIYIYIYIIKQSSCTRSIFIKFGYNFYNRNNASDSIN